MYPAGNHRGTFSERFSLELLVSLVIEACTHGDGPDSSVVREVIVL
jgi:hypothetical protein